MELINQTPIVARVEAAEVSEDSFRIGMLSAKATFRFHMDGSVELDTQDPFPLFNEDQTLPVGILPSDADPRRSGAFEVILLGKAYAPYGRAVQQLCVALTVGSVRRELIITGDRYWGVDGRGGRVISAPQPFVQMPLTYEHAFGGTQVAQIDQSSLLDLSFPLNPYGRGFDAEGLARGVCEMLRAPAGYPQLPNYARMLPNIESPNARVARWEDAPDPVGWATTPRDMPLNPVLRARALAQAQGTHRPEQLVPDLQPTGNELEHVDSACLRAHPDWVIPVPATAPVICLENLLPQCPKLQFQVPDVRVVADYLIEGRYGTRALIPQRFVILPDESRFYVVYRMPFTFECVKQDERAFRLRSEAGWFAGDSSQPSSAA